MNIKIKLKFCEFKELLNFCLHYSATSKASELLLIDKINLKNFLYKAHKKNLDLVINCTTLNTKKTFLFDVNHLELINK